MTDASSNGMQEHKVQAVRETCEVIGWLLVDTGRAQVMVREANGNVSLQASAPSDSFTNLAIQTGRFSRRDLAHKPDGVSEGPEGAAWEDQLQEG